MDPKLALEACPLNLKGYDDLTLCMQQLTPDDSACGRFHAYFLAYNNKTNFYFYSVSWFWFLSLALAKSLKQFCSEQLFGRSCKLASLFTFWVQKIASCIAVMWMKLLWNDF